MIIKSSILFMKFNQTSDSPFQGKSEINSDENQGHYNLPEKNQGKSEVTPLTEHFAFTLVCFREITISLISLLPCNIYKNNIFRSSKGHFSEFRQKKHKPGGGPPRHIHGIVWMTSSENCRRYVLKNSFTDRPTARRTDGRQTHSDRTIPGWLLHLG